MHAEAYAFVATAAQHHQPGGVVYEIGSRNINGTVRGLFRNAAVYIGVDVVGGPDVDLVADAATYRPPLPPATVVCCEVLEHTEKAEAIVTQAASVLAPGGLLIITCAGEGRAPHSAYDGGPLREGEYYRNLLPWEIRQWASEAGVDAVQMSWSENPGDSYYVGRKRGHS